MLLERPFSDSDSFALRRLAELDSQRPLTGRMLRLRAYGIEAFRRMPVLRDRLLAGLGRPARARERAA